LGEAMKSPHWPLFQAAMVEEIKGKMANQAWLVVERPTSTRVHKSKWVFAVSYNEDESDKRVKARFVACGYSQSSDDFDKVFAATLPGIAFRFLLACIADEDLETDIIDAIKAFTQAEVDKDLFVEMPRGFETEGCVLFLLKALEGIKQGGHL